MKHLVLSLDTTNKVQAINIVNNIKNNLAMVKIGHYTISSFTHQEIGGICQDIPIMLDLKFFDIPTTILNAISNYKKNIPNINCFTFSADISDSAIKEIIITEKKENIQALAVLILSSNNINEKDFILKAKRVFNFGIRNFICPPAYIKLMRHTFANEVILYTPGVRSNLEQLNDHALSINAKESLTLGTNYIIVGRPLLQSENLKKTILEYT